MRRWYLVHTKPASEKLARENLCRQGYEVYLPRATQCVRWGGVRRNRVVPLFPRYVFVQLAEGLQALAPVRSSVGVADIVRFGSRFAVVRDAVIEDLRSRADPDTGLHCLAGVRLEPGAPVSISGGPFEGLDGVFQREAGEERVVVLLRMLGRETQVGVPSAYVFPGHAA